MTKLIITGCGRSGTKFLSSLLNYSGIRCGHESVFTYEGFKGWNNYDADSSWYAAPYLNNLNKDEVKIIHVVRNPIDVVKSFYRLGIMAKVPIKAIFMNYKIDFLIRTFLLNPRTIIYRINLVCKNQMFLKKHCDVFDEKNEIYRILSYWKNWNQLIEQSAINKDLAYFRFKIEDVSEIINELSEFIGKPVNYRKELSNSEKNIKNQYSNRPLNQKIQLNNDIQMLMKKYGY